MRLLGRQPRAFPLNGTLIYRFTYSILFLGRTERCACVKDFGVSLYNPGSKANNGDLDNPHIKPYEQCPDSKASSCQVNKGE